jgi:outer membrane protein assembly factor BamB
VVGDILLVAISGQLAAYDLATGNPRWLVPTGGGSYSSPHLLTLGGVPQVVLLSGVGATSVAPADGKVLWKHEWPGVSMLQPTLMEAGGLLITMTDMGRGAGTRRIAVSQGAGGWTANEVWTSKGLKPYYNDLVIHNGHAYGFDGGILACIDLKDGARKWKGGRYGHGQMVLLRDQDLLLVLSEEGELALVGATPGQFSEVARFQAIEGKTWNHPVLAGDIVLVRNGQEMAAFRLGQRPS